MKSTLCLLLLVGYLTVQSGCVNNTTLKTFDLENGRKIRVTTGWPDDLLPIYYEMSNKDGLITRCFILQESPESSAVSKLRFKVLRDKSDQVFVLMQDEPETGSLAILDFSTNFRFPCCSNDNGQECINKRNNLAELLERDNPGLRIERLTVPQPQP